MDQGEPRQRHWAYFGLGILPFTISAWNLDASLISWPAWPGYVKGLVITLLDPLALAVITTNRGPRGLPRCRGTSSPISSPDCFRWQCPRSPWVRRSIRSSCCDC